MATHKSRFSRFMPAINVNWFCDVHMMKREEKTRAVCIYVYTSKIGLVAVSVQKISSVSALAAVVAFLLPGFPTGSSLATKKERLTLSCVISQTKQVNVVVVPDAAIVSRRPVRSCPSSSRS